MMGNKSKPASLFSEFPPVSTDEWEEMIVKDLKGADYEQKLIWKTTEGINIKPYYRAEDLAKLGYLNAAPGEFPYVRGIGKNNNWEIRQDIDEQNPAEANRLAIDIIARGANAVGFNANEISNSDDIRTLLHGVDLSKVSLHFTSASSWNFFYKLFFDEIKRQKTDTGIVKGSFNFDSLGYLLLYGKVYPSNDDKFDEAAEFVENISRNLPCFKAITINGQYFHNAGASITQELAYCLASGSEYLVQLTGKGINIDDIAERLQFVFAIGSDYFPEIAKLRAARLLWAKIVEKFNPQHEAPLKMNIHAVTSLWNKTIYDPYVNMLRSATEAMSAAIGGCKSMSVNPFDCTFKKPDEFSERIARNTQLILKSESYLDEVVDPSAGSYYIETLTDAIAEAAWKLFLEVEEKGGFIESVRSGIIKEAIEMTCQKRDMDIAMRRQIILGTNQYPNQDENMLDKIRPNSDITHLGGLKQYRGAQAFEALRLSTEAYEKDGNKRPAVFLITYGDLHLRKERADFASNFFASGGFNIIDNPGFSSIEEGVNAALQSKAEIVVFCSSDDEYPEMADNACIQLKTSNPDVMIIVAGHPLNYTDQLKEKGVDDFIHLRSNVLETIAKYQHLLGII